MGRKAATSRRGYSVVDGYSLVELMLVVTLIFTIAAIAVPGILGAVKSANEGSAIASLREVRSAQTQYRIRFGTYAVLADLAASGYLDPSLSTGAKRGYTFAEPAPPSDGTWSMAASPSTQGITGDRHFHVDESGVLRAKDSAPASSGDAPLD